ncbi:hypothetical protein HY949_02140 [Candidatus Gottesmanbacteria bacterium]|nr:hypothetical protein [Candidatus Gottesmanbacteria bacterium]
MEEQIGEMEKIAEADALRQETAEAQREIELDMKDPAQSTADAAGEVGMVQEMWNVMKKHGETAKDLTWKNAKAYAAAGLSLVPLLGATGTLVKFGAAAEAGKAALSADKAFKAMSFAGDIGDAALLAKNTARSEFWSALKNIPRNPVHLAADPIHSAQEAWGARKNVQEAMGFSKIATELANEGLLSENKTRTAEVINKKMSEAQGAYSGAKKQLGKDVVISGGLHLMHKIDPYPDVPPTLAMVAGFAEFVLPGANIVPAVWQLMHNQNEWGKMVRGLALDMGKVVMKRFDGKMSDAKKPDVTAAAGVFVQPSVG